MIAPLGKRETLAPLIGFDKCCRQSCYFGHRYGPCPFCTICDSKFPHDACKQTDQVPIVSDSHIAQSDWLHLICASQHVWVQRHPDHIRSSMSQYLRCKSQKPAATSACLVVRYWEQTQPWLSLVCRMRSLQTYPVNTCQYFGQPN